MPKNVKKTNLWQGKVSFPHFVTAIKRAQYDQNTEKTAAAVHQRSAAGNLWLWRKAGAQCPAVLLPLLLPTLHPLLQLQT